jgi:hypothetical protein
MKRYFFTAVLVTLAMTGALAQGSNVEVLAEKDTVWMAMGQMQMLGKRNIHRIDIAYDSTDPEGNPARISGAIAIPEEIYQGQKKCNGMVLGHYFSRMHPSQTMTAGDATMASLILANPLSPNYIFVCSDCWGFGITSGRQQSYLHGLANGQAGIDCLLAARDLLGQRGIECGKYLFNAGFSAGAYDALAAQIIRDQKYRDVLSFDKTFLAEAPIDIEPVFQYVLANPDTTVALPATTLMTIVYYNKLENLGYENNQMFKEPYASYIDEWYFSGRHTNFELENYFSRAKCIGDILHDDFFDFKSKLHQDFLEAIRRNLLTEGWEPDESQHYYVMHLNKDNTVPIEAGRSLVDYLKSTGKFKESVLGGTNLQTNLYLNVKEHGMGFVLISARIAIALALWPATHFLGGHTGIDQVKACGGKPAIYSLGGVRQTEAMQRSGIYIQRGVDGKIHKVIKK